MDTELVRLLDFNPEGGDPTLVEVTMVSGARHTLATRPGSEDANVCRWLHRAIAAASLLPTHPNDSIYINAGHIETFELRR